MQVFRRIVCASDFSIASAPAMRRAVQLAVQNECELTVVHVVALEEPMTADVYIAPAMFESVRDAARVKARKRLQRLQEGCEKAGARCAVALLEGRAYEEIVNFARARKADLVVLGTHGRSGISKLLAGSVAERVVRFAPCPVLTVRASK